jgi:hypothetical protein
MPALLSSSNCLTVPSRAAFKRKAAMEGVHAEGPTDEQLPRLAVQFQSKEN